MLSKIRNIGIAQSGGPTCVINATLAGAFKRASVSGAFQEIYGFRHGVDGILNRNAVNLRDKITSPIELALLRQTPAAALGSCRTKLPDPSCPEGEEMYERLVQSMQYFGIGAFLYIGGNDSMDTAHKLSQYIKKTGREDSITIVGVPKTIDNDIIITDHTPGFGSAAKYIACCMQEITRDAEVYAVDSVTIVEIMGRDAGWLAASSAVIRANGETAPHLIYLPETAFDEQKFLDDVKTAIRRYRNVVVAVSEGIKNAQGEYAAKSALSGVVDVFGHSYLAGAGKYLEDLVRNEIGCKVRSVELNVSQRAASHIASLRDLDEADMVGAEAVNLAIDKQNGKMVVIQRTSKTPYMSACDTIDLDTVANKAKPFPLEWINSEHNGVTQEAIDYILPLIQGEPNNILVNGLPKHFYLV